MNEWKQLGLVAPKDLTEARLQLHWAAQLPAAVGSSLVPAKPDDSHTALVADVERSLLVSGETDGRRVALSVPELRVVVLDDTAHEPITLDLTGKTLRQGLDWLETKLGSGAIRVPDYEMPHHAIQDGGAFQCEQPDAFHELSSWFTNAAGVLRGLELGDDLCWPHHFDIASLLTLGDDKSVGVGLSPGDGSYDEPYWYIAPWPHPAAADLPELTIGHWHTEGFVAAILTGSEITAESDAARQRAMVDAFIEASVSGSKKLLA